MAGEPSLPDSRFFLQSPSAGSPSRQDHCARPGLADPPCSPIQSPDHNVPPPVPTPSARILIEATLTKLHRFSSTEERRQPCRLHAALLPTSTATPGPLPVS